MKKISFSKSPFFLFAMNMKKKKRISLESSDIKRKKRMKKRKCLKCSQQRQQESISCTKTTTEPDFYLPDDCWEHVFTFLYRDFNSLSLVSKHFLSITSRLIFSLTISDPPPSFSHTFFHRFSNLISLDLWFTSPHPHAAIASALHHRPSLKSLTIYRIELKHANHVTSRYIDSIISLKGLNSLKLSGSRISVDLLYSIAKEGLPLKSFVLENCTGYSYNAINCLLSNCQTIQHFGLQIDPFLNADHVVCFSLLLPHLVSINLSQCRNLTESALFALISNCHSLTEITIEHIYTRRGSVENSDSFKGFHVNPQLKFLYLAHNSFIKNETIILFASIFPNLQLLDLSYCYHISQEGICQILSRCLKVRHLNLAYCNEVRQLKMNFLVPQLEVLNLSGTWVDDKTLYQISNSCCGLLQLLLSCCPQVTKKGVMHVVENCTQLKEIDLRFCGKVNGDDVVSMVLSRHSFKITI